MMHCVQAQMIDLRSDLLESRTLNVTLEKEIQSLTVQLHASQLQLAAASGQDVCADDALKKMASYLCVPSSGGL
jgi:hypothetical protein